MILLNSELTVSSNSRTELINLDSRIQALINENQIDDGVCLVFVPHTTAGVTINENADPDVVKDLTTELNKIIPFQDNYLHAEGNSAAHIKSTLVGASETVFIQNGRLKLGTWQSIFFCEFDGPRSRKVWIQILK